MGSECKKQAITIDTDFDDSQSERIIKSKYRVQKHGEVLTPSWMVNKMLDTEGIKEACTDLTTTFLEPGPGEGAFLTEILRRKLTMVAREYDETIMQYENFSLLALSTLYGVELLEDNTQICSMNLFEVYKDSYEIVARKCEKRTKSSVLDSAKTIIAKNIVQGNFLTRETPEGKPIVFSEWKPKTKPTKRTRTIRIIRTEYSFDDIISKRSREPGTTWKPPTQLKQLGLFSNEIQGELFSELESSTISQSSKRDLRYVVSKITDVYKEEMEDYAGSPNE